MTRQTIREAYNTINPTREEKLKMLDAILAESPTAYEESAPRKEYQRRAPRRPRGVLPAVAVLALVVAASVFLMWWMPQGGQQMSASGWNSLVEFQNSALYQAHREWDAYLESYDPDGSIYASDKNVSGELPEGYTIYGIFTQEMTDRFHEILDKYSLTHQWQRASVDSVPQMLLQLDASSLCVSGRAGVQTQYRSGCYYPSGSFCFDAVTTMDYDSSPWTYPVEFRFLYNKAEDFLCDFPELGQAGEYEQWSYTTVNGVSLVLAVSSGQALILADRTDAVILITVSNPRVGDVVYGELTMDRDAMEALAETFDFAFLSGRTDAREETTEPETTEGEPTETETMPAETMPTTQAYEHVLQTYEDAIAQNWDPSQCQERDISILVSYVETPNDLGYALIDLDGNGSNELLISDGNVIYDLYTLTDDGPYHVFTGWERNSYTLCEGNVIANRGSNGAASSVNNFFRFSGTELVQQQIVTYDAYTDQDNPWFVGIDMEPVSESEAQAIIDSYIQVPIEIKPLTQRP